MNQGNTIKVHPVEIPGYEGDDRKRLLADILAGLRFDEQAKLLRYYEKALRKNAANDEMRLGRKVLAKQWLILAGQVESVHKWLSHMFEMFKKYMKDELSEKSVQH